MKRFILTTVLSGLAAFGLEWILPWWIIAVVPFVFCAILLPKPGRAFLSGFLAIGIMWAATIGWRLSNGNTDFVASLAELFMLPPNASLFITISIGVGALIGGLSGLSGALLAKMRA